MEGFTVGKSQNMLRTPEAMREFKTTNIAPLDSSKETDTFSQALTKAVDQVNDLQKTADVKIQQLATGQSDNIPDVMMAVEKADIAMKLMMTVRNKMIDAYQEVMKMQV